MCSYINSVHAFVIHNAASVSNDWNAGGAWIYIEWFHGETEDYRTL